MTNLKCVLAAISLLVMSSGLLAKSLPQTKAERVGMSSERLDRITAVSYTHLTLPTMLDPWRKTIYFEFTR